MSYLLMHDPENKRFVIDLGEGDVAEITYRKSEDNAYVLEHTIVPEKHNGKGIAKVLATQTLAAIERENKRAILECPYLHAFVTKHPEWISLLQ